MSSTTTQTITQQGPVSTKMKNDDSLKNKIIEHLSQLALDPDFQKASATYSQVKEQQEQIRIRDEKLAKLQKDIKAQEENEVLALSKLSAVNQTLTTQKENAERKNASLRKELTEKEKALTEISRRIQEHQSQIQTQLSERSQDERKMNSIVAQHNLDIDSLQRNLKERDGAIDKMRATTANLTSLLAVEKAKSDCLEKERKSLDEMVRKARSRLEKFDAFVLKSHQVDEQSMLVLFLECHVAVY
jgi:chromosome segregation ATPase